jgi:hypothetical protein
MRRFIIEQPINPDLLTTYLLASSDDIRDRAARCLLLTLRVSLILRLAEYGYRGDVDNLVSGIITVALELMFDDKEIPICTFDIEHKNIMTKGTSMLKLFANAYSELR